MRRKLILLELNEVPFRVLDEFRWRWPRSCLARIRDRTREFATVAEDRGHLSPWVTWSTLHRGVRDDEHGIAAFGQNLGEVNDRFPPIWRILQRHGIRAGVCGSLHSSADVAELDRYAFFIPDTFAAGSECFPKRLSAFQQFNLEMTRASARNVARGIRWAPALAMLLRSPSLGLRASTLADVAVQLVSERLKPARVCRRRTYQGLLAFDVFMRQLRSSKPDFATFFTNHVASAMHRYWAARFPHDYAELGFDDTWIGAYRDEIDFAMVKADRCIGRLVQFVERHPEYTLWIATSMGQAAHVGQPYRAELLLTDPDRFLAALGIPAEGWTRRPAMMPQVNVVVAEDQRPRLRAMLRALLVQGRPIEFTEADHGFFSITISVLDPDEDHPVVELDGRAVPWSELGLSAVRIEDRACANGYHIPQGMLLCFESDKAGRLTRPEVSTREIAPQILRFFDVPVPGYMQSAKARIAA